MPTCDEVLADCFPKDHPVRTVVQLVALMLTVLTLEVHATAALK